MKAKELRQKTIKELQELLQEKRKRLSQLKFDLSLRKLKNTREIREVKKDIARVLTILKVKDIEDKNIRSKQE
ncbi:50S ribosomal protein L29 [bacterium]|nr:50S ribosomal protein L29 [bacterium]